MKPSLILLNKIRQFSVDKVQAVIDYLGDSEAIFRVSPGTLGDIPGLSPADREGIISLRDSRELDDELRLIERGNIKAIDFWDADYPVLLREIASPPLLLYLRGDPGSLGEFCFSIVGTRSSTVYGRATAKAFSARLAGLGMVIVSGLARGIDTAAHSAALASGRTIAVLGSGLLNIYPGENRTLAERIVEQGAVVSEFPLREAPLRENFPRRNRIISGLSRGVLIVEAAERSGALITARYALEQNREVFAVPGIIDSPFSRGPHRLIRDGAILVESVEDIVGELNVSWSAGSQNRETDLPLRKKKDVEGVKINKVILGLGGSGLLKENRPLFYVRKNYE